MWYCSKDFQWPSDMKDYQDYQTVSLYILMLLPGKPDHLDKQATATDFTTAGSNVELDWLRYLVQLPVRTEFIH
jgi:hypothetical protein